MLTLGFDGIEYGRLDTITRRRRRAMASTHAIAGRGLYDDRHAGRRLMPPQVLLLELPARGWSFNSASSRLRRAFASIFFEPPPAAAFDAALPARHGPISPTPCSRLYFLAGYAILAAFDAREI